DALPAHRRALPGRHLRRDRAGGRARRRWGDTPADAHVDRDHGEPHPARDLGHGAVGDRGAVVDDLHHGAAARRRDARHLARGALEAELDRVTPGSAAAARRRAEPHRPRGSMSRLITLLTDFGTADGYVGEVKAVLATLAPSATIVDVAHDVSPHDVDGARLALAP